MRNTKKVIVGLSGGVDSAVSLFLLKKQGFDTIGVFLKMGSWQGRSKNSEQKQINTVKKICSQMNIPCYILDCSSEFKKKVIDYFKNSLKKGLTPNPCVICNHDLKFKKLIQFAKIKKADYVATGHYARIKRVGDKYELLRAKELSLPIYSYPEYLYEQSKNKIRVVIGGSHGKTTITAMVLHVLEELGYSPDYMVGSKLDGFEVMVKLSDESKIMVLEGDEYLSSPIDRRPKFHLYKPNIALLSGIAWDHMNVFPTFENYKEQFAIFISLIEKDGTLVFSSSDKNVVELAKNRRKDINAFAYHECDSIIKEGKTFIIYEAKRYELQVFGKHNLQNINGARYVCQALGVNPPDFFNAITSFAGTSNRLELIGKNKNTVIYKDFAHSPSKLKATTSAVKEQFGDYKLLACMELHTFSSLNKAFLSQYAEMPRKPLPV